MTQIFRRIVVAIDRSRPAKQATELAMRLARTHESELLFVHAIDYSLFAGEGDHDILDAVTRNGNEILRQAKERAANAGIPSRTVLVEGRPDLAVTRYAEEIAADAIVVGTRGPAASERFFLGSSAEGILRLAIAPVFVVHDVPLSSSTTFKSIVVAIDNSDPADAAVELGTRLAGVDGSSRLAFCHIVDDDTLYEEAANFGGATYPVLQEWLDEAAILSRSAAAQAEGNGVHGVETSVLTGNPVSEILNFASSHAADLIVIGAHGRRGLRHLVMGAVAQGVVRRSTTPVLVVRMRAVAARRPAIHPHVDHHGYVTMRADA